MCLDFLAELGQVLVGTRRLHKFGHPGMATSSNLTCSKEGQKDPGGEILSIHRTCDLELSSSLCQVSVFILF